MGIEIERKFLLRDGVWRDLIERSEHLAQGYLTDAGALREGSARASVRVRVSHTQAWLNIKAARLGIERAEFEYPLPLTDARELLESLCGGVLEKIRHHVHVEDTHFEIDEFLGQNAGLVVAEVELPSVDAPFARPAWLGQEVSEQSRYFNVCLIDYPYGRWTAAERQGQAGAAC